MTSSYTFNQKGALFTIIAAAILIRIIILGMVLKLTIKTSASGFQPVEGIVWILILLYAIRFKWSYLAGIAGAVSGFSMYLTLYFWFPEARHWWLLPNPVESFLHILLQLVAIACIYFSYRSFIEIEANSSIQGKISTA